MMFLQSLQFYLDMEYYRIYGTGTGIIPVVREPNNNTEYHKARYLVPYPTSYNTPGMMNEMMMSETVKRAK